jgi:hypothetical protein
MVSPFDCLVTLYLAYICELDLRPKTLYLMVIIISSFFNFPLLTVKSAISFNMFSFVLILQKKPTKHIYMAEAIMKTHKDTE